MHASIDTVFIADTKMTDAQRTQRRFDYSAAPPTQRCFFSKIRKGFYLLLHLRMNPAHIIAKEDETRLGSVGLGWVRPL